MIRLVILVFLFTLCPQIVAAQHAEQRVKNLLREIAPERPKVRVLFRSLVTGEGKLVKLDDDSFYLKKGRRYFRSFYRDVLEIRGGGKFVSNVQDIDVRQHGSWSDINQVYAGTKILVLLTDGKTVKGFSNSATETGLVIIERERHERMDIARTDVAAFYGLVGGYGGVKKGASKGAEGMTTGRDQLLTGIFAGVGALAGLAKSDGRPILIYSR